MDKWLLRCWHRARPKVWDSHSGTLLPSRWCVAGLCASIFPPSLVWHMTASIGILEKSNCFSISPSCSLSLRILYVRSLHKYSSDPSSWQRGDASECSFSSRRRAALYARCDSPAFTPLSREMSTEPDSTSVPTFPVAELMSTSVAVNEFSALLAYSVCTVCRPPAGEEDWSSEIETEANQCSQ